MTTERWENLPQPRPSGSPAGAWAGFSADPRAAANRGLRASDADRSFALTVLAQAAADGRLTQPEQRQRADLAARTTGLGELGDLVADLLPAAPAIARRGWGGVAVRGWLALAALFNAIWLLTVLTTGRLLYYWPMWPMLGTAIPVVFGLVMGGPAPWAQDQPARPEAQRAAHGAASGARPALSGGSGRGRRSGQQVGVIGVLGDEADHEGARRTHPPLPGRADVVQREADESTGHAAAPERRLDDGVVEDRDVTLEPVARHPGEFVVDPRLVAPLRRVVPDVLAHALS
jgi:hypothetical protein